MSKYRGTNWFKQPPTWVRHTRGAECVIMLMRETNLFHVSCHGGTWQSHGAASTLKAAKLLAASLVKEHNKRELSPTPLP